MSAPTKTSGSKLKSVTTKLKNALTLKAPVETISVRFSTNHGIWVEVAKDNADDIIRTLPTPSYMSNVTFSEHDIVVRSHSGCGGSAWGKAGVATGEFHLDRPKKCPATGWDNLGFSPGGFTARGNVLKTVPYLMLESARFAKVHLTKTKTKAKTIVADGVEN